MKKSPLKQISNKRAKQLREEKKLTMRLYIKQKGLCLCGASLDTWRSSKHEIVKRSAGGDPTDEDNCVLLCGRCHSREHGIVER